jgi:hypothetical protein
MGMGGGGLPNNLASTTNHIFTHDKAFAWIEDTQIIKFSNSTGSLESWNWQKRLFSRQLASLVSYTMGNTSIL